MIEIPLVFWLVLTLGSGGSFSVNSVVLPVPFSSAADCDIAGEQWLRKYNSSYVCLQQRKSDVPTPSTSSSDHQP